MKRLTTGLIILLLLNIYSLYALPLQIDYYGVVTLSDDTNMLKMAQDLFLAQLKSIDNATVDDKRANPSETASDIPDFSTSTGSRIVFYAEITEKKAESADQTKWICTFNAKNIAKDRSETKTEEYDSYYKILVNAKTAIETVITPFRDDTEIPLSIDRDITEPSVSYTESQNFSIEHLAGTWTGEPFTDKIIILRGGRGFIIFKNGATMNIAITMEYTDGRRSVKIRQTGNQNASFYPYLPREEALKVAATAAPMEWTFTDFSDTRLAGTKTTPETQQQEIIWTKR